MNNKLKIAALSAALTASPLVAFAVVSDACALMRQVFSVIRIFGSVILALSVVMILYSAFLFVTGGGNPETLTKARNILLFSLIGLAVALLATSGQAIVSGLLPQGEFVQQCRDAI